MDISVLVIDTPLSPGARCRLLRVARYCTQYRLAAAARVSPSDVSLLERDLPVCPAVKRRILACFVPNAGGWDG